MNIPYLLWQTWKHPHPPSPLKRCISSFHKLNPGWEIKLCTDADIDILIDTEFPELRETINLFPGGVYLADIWRCLILYKFGGVYSDIDVECIRPLDELIATATEQGFLSENTSLILTRDHPIHESTHFGGRPMYMNHFMIAEPGAIFLKLFIDDIVNLAKNRPEELGIDPVNLTGPGRFSSIIGSATSLNELEIALIPWQWTHPLPDMAIPGNFPDKKNYDSLIRSGDWSWKLNPFVAHYWWHNYINSYNTFTKYGLLLFQSDGLIANQRLERLISKNDEEAAIIGRGIAEFAEHEPKNLFISKTLDLSYPHTLIKLATEALQGMKVTRIHSLEVSHFEGKSKIGLFHLSAVRQERDQCLDDLHDAISTDCIADNGLILIEANSSDSNFLDACRKKLKSSNFEILEEGPPLLYRKLAPEPQVLVPKVIHQTWKDENIPEIFKQEWIDSWMELNGPNGWQYRFWTDQDLINLVEEYSPDFLDCYFDYDQPIKRVDAARYLILKNIGGVYADLDFACLKPLDKLLYERKLVFGTEFSDLGHTGAICNAFMAGIPNHPFWDGIEYDLRSHAKREVLFATGPHFLTRRCRNAASFMVENHFPTIVQKNALYPFRWNEKIKEQDKQLHIKDLAKKYPDTFAITFWTGSWI